VLCRERPGDDQTLTNLGPAVTRPLWPVSAAPNPIMIPLDLAGLRRGLASVNTERRRHPGTFCSVFRTAACLGDRLPIGLHKKAPPSQSILLSVALLTGNRPGSMKRALASLRAQERQPFEAIVSNTVWQVLERYARWNNAGRMRFVITWPR